MPRVGPWIIAGALLLGAHVAAAQPADVTPPAAIDAGHVVYPSSAHGDAVVVVDLVVEKDGRVGDVSVVDGDEPFVAAVLAAARAWTFTPAHRGDLPVAAKVRMRIDFHPPRPAASPKPPAATPGPPPAKPGAPKVVEPPADVEIRGVRNEVGQTQLGGAEVRQMPGAFGDAFRAIEALPGVTPIVSGLPFNSSSSAARPPATSATSSTAFASRSSSTSASARASFTRRSSRASTSTRAPIPRGSAASPAASSTARPSPPPRACTRRATSASSTRAPSRRPPSSTTASPCSSRVATATPRRSCSSSRRTRASATGTTRPAPSTA